MYTRGNHLSNATCLIQAFFKSVEQFSKHTNIKRVCTSHKTGEAALDK